MEQLYHKIHKLGSRVRVSNLTLGYLDLRSRVLFRLQSNTEKSFDSQTGTMSTCIDSYRICTPFPFLKRVLYRNMLKVFDSQTKDTQVSFLAPQFKKRPEGRFLNWGATGNRTQIEGSTNLSVNRYTITPILFLILLKLLFYTRKTFKKKAYWQDVASDDKPNIKADAIAEHRHQVHHCLITNACRDIR